MLKACALYSTLQLHNGVIHVGINDLSGHGLIVIAHFTSEAHIWGGIILWLWGLECVFVWTWNMLVGKKRPQALPDLNAVTVLSVQNQNIFTTDQNTIMKHNK